MKIPLLQVRDIPQDLIDDYFDIRDFNNETVMESIRFDHTIYDMLYMTLARRTGSLLLTLDKKLKRIALSEGVDVAE